MTPWQKIMRAYNDRRGVRGLRLTPDDVMQLGEDAAIETKAANDDEDDCERTQRHKFNGGTHCSKCGAERARRA